MGKEKLKVKLKAFSCFNLLVPSFIFSVIFLSTSHASVTSLALDQAIQRMLDNNLTIKTLGLNYESAQINYDIAWNTFYIPQFTLGMNSTSGYSVGSLPGTPGRLDPGSFASKGYPASTISLALGQYTLFNFFKDRANYDMAKLNYERAKLRFQEQVRGAKFALINLYFQTKIAQEKLEAAERSVAISQAIAELLDSRKSLGKATEDEQNSASVDLLNAQVAYSNEKKNVDQISINLKTTLNATPETELKLTTEPPFVPVQLDEKHFFDLYRTQSSTARDAELSLTVAEMTAALAEKSRLPLPTLSFSGITLNYADGYAGGIPPTYVSSNNTNGMLEVAATLSLSIPIFGPAGFFNEKTVRSAYIQRESAEIAQKNAMMNGELTIRQKISTIQQLESQIKTLRESLAKSSKVLNNTFKKAATSSAMDRLQLRDALLQARQTELSYLDSLLGHISEKNGLADFIGLEKLPGDQI